MSSWENDNPWDFKIPHVEAPEPKARPQKLLPEADRLFQVQRNALRALNDIEELKRHVEKSPHAAAALRRLEQDVENTYRVIRSYLDKYANPESPGGTV